MRWEAIGCLLIGASLAGCFAADEPAPAGPPIRVADEAELTFTWEPEAPTVGDLVGFSPSGSIPADREIVSWSWDFGDGTTSTSAAPAHRYGHEGPYHVVARFTLSDGESAEARDIVTILAPRPTADDAEGGNETADAPGPSLPNPDPGATPLTREFACAGRTVVEPFATHGQGDPQFPDLTWGALKTGFRFGVGFTAPGTATLELVYEGQTQTYTDLGLSDDHAFLIERLPLHTDACFRVGVGELWSDWHGVRFANSWYAFDEASDTYTLNLAILSNEQSASSVLEAGMHRMASLIWDGTDGHIRIGTVLVLQDDLGHHNSGWASCYIPSVSSPACNALVDAIYTVDAFPGGAASTYKDGIADPEAAMWMNLYWQAAPWSAIIDLDDTGAVLTHEIGHYAFGAQDLYNGPGCDLPGGVSIMGSDRDNYEFDGPNAPCPPGASGGEEYIPSWTLIQERHPRIPDRPEGPANGPAGNGGAFRLLMLDLVSP